ncbi:SDR family oxidoreductase [Nocardioides sp.]|uniref:SDR family NAD(P)-dependent oxidoreductase n=1 Tax=Nocardioides sp. TaxID=35761 RepID=UPI002719F639|nr:SDR family NAD(P)-dependent oxidoreductase [Nocardioides sp.]MDO9457075.1 SDR family NAD(P)-dependent oxidoreductase [Nocardioides sp.]
MSDAPVAVVTGAAGQIGRRLLDAFADQGYPVVGLDLPDALPAGDDRFVARDLTDAEQVRAVVGGLGRIDVLVHNAGLSAIGGFEDHDVTTHAAVLAVNYLGPVALTQAALPALRAARGRVVVMGSVAGFAPVVGRPAYVGSKHAVTGLFEALRPELARDGVGVTLVHPTFVTGGMSEAAGRVEGRGRSTTGQRVTPEDVASAVVEAVDRGRDRVLVGRTARLSWHVHRLAPRLYVHLMTRRLKDTP